MSAVVAICLALFAIWLGLSVVWMQREVWCATACIIAHLWGIAAVVIVTLK